MPRYGLALAAVVLTGNLVLAQMQNPPPVDGTPEQLDTVLKRWEREMSSVKTLVAECQRTEKNNTFEYTEVFSGAAKYMKLETGDRITHLASLYMENKKNPQIYEKFICTGDFLYQFLPQQKELRVHTIQRRDPKQVADDSFLSFLFGMKAADAKKRYDMALKYDTHYYYVYIRPRLPQDKADFQQARLTLNRQTDLPVQLWFEQPNDKTQVTWDLPPKQMQKNPPVDRKEFTTPEKPAGWQVREIKRTEAEAQPRIVRPKP
jgi:TIGR03009 family protein